MFDKTERMLQLEALPENAGNDILFIIEKDYFQRLGEEYPSAVYGQQNPRIIRKFAEIKQNPHGKNLRRLQLEEQILSRSGRGPQEGRPRSL